MKKNAVKINESTIRKMVAESLRKALNEIDWKTYANAANKRRKQYRDEIKNGIDSDKWRRAQELDKAASRAISDKFGRNLETWGDNFDGETGDRHVMDADAPWTTGTDARGPEPTGYYYTSSKDRDWRNGGDEYQDGDYDLYGDIPLDFKSQSEEDKQNNNIGREIDNFTHDRYAYDNEKGWHLKEAVKRAVKSVLKEWIDDMNTDVDRVTPGDSLPIIDTAPRHNNRWEKSSKSQRMVSSIYNQIQNKEGLGETYSLKDLANDIARRFKASPTFVLQQAKIAYKKLNAHMAMDM